MDVESRRDLQLLEALEQASTITQRTLATRLGIALGLTNLYLKRLIRKGYVKCVTVAPNRLVYSLTPRSDFHDENEAALAWYQQPNRLALISLIMVIILNIAFW